MMHITLSQNSCIYDGRISTASVSDLSMAARRNLNSDCISLFDGLGTAVDKQVFISHAFSVLQRYHTDRQCQHRFTPRATPASFATSFIASQLAAVCAVQESVCLLCIQPELLLLLPDRSQPRISTRFPNLQLSLPVLHNHQEPSAL